MHAGPPGSPDPARSPPPASPGGPPYLDPDLLSDAPAPETRLIRSLPLFRGIAFAGAGVWQLVAAVYGAQTAHDNAARDDARKRVADQAWKKGFLSRNPEFHGGGAPSHEQFDYLMGCNPSARRAAVLDAFGPGADASWFGFCGLRAVVDPGDGGQEGALPLSGPVGRDSPGYCYLRLIPTLLYDAGLRVDLGPNPTARAVLDAFTAVGVPRPTSFVGSGPPGLCHVDPAGPTLFLFPGTHEAFATGRPYTRLGPDDRVGAPIDGGTTAAPVLVASPPDNHVTIRYALDADARGAKLLRDVREVGLLAATWRSVRLVAVRGSLATDSEEARFYVGLSPVRRGAATAAGTVAPPDVVDITLCSGYGRIDRAGLVTGHNETVLTVPADCTDEIADCVPARGAYPPFLHLYYANPGDGVAVLELEFVVGGGAYHAVRGSSTLV